MAIRDKIVANTQPHLQPGERGRAVFSRQTASQCLILVGVVPFALMNNYRTVVATDRRILVVNSGELSSTRAKAIVGERSRDVRFGAAPRSDQALGRYQPSAAANPPALPRGCRGNGPPRLLTAGTSRLPSIA